MLYATLGIVVTLHRLSTRENRVATKKNAAKVPPASYPKDISLSLQYLLLMPSFSLLTECFFYSFLEQ
jgi:hypothetical protein